MTAPGSGGAPSTTDAVPWTKLLADSTVAVRDVAVSSTAREVRIDFAVTNTAGEPIWIVDLDTPEQFADPDHAGGVLILTRINPHVDEGATGGVQAPQVSLVAVGDDATLDKQLTLWQPYFDSWNGEDPPATLRVCIGLIPHSALSSVANYADPANGSVDVTRSTAARLQQYACSAVVPFPADAAALFKN